MDPQRGHISTQSSPHVLLITLSRPRKLNALSKSMLHALHPIIKSAISEGKKLIFKGDGQHFCCGGDIIHMYKNPPHGHKYLSIEYQLFLRISDYITTKVAIMSGFTLGSGAGFAYLSNIRIATDSTQWGFPECANGSLPDLGATFILGRLRPEGVGLYLGLTGTRVGGGDCYCLGIATHYVAEQRRVEEMLREMMDTGNLLEIAEKYHSEPDLSLCPIFTSSASISRCFSNVSRVEDILARLSHDSETSWSRQALQSLRDNCPYVLKIAYECLLSTTALTYSECLRIEYRRDCNVYDKRFRNYHIGIRFKFQEKRQGRPPWEPGRIEEVTDRDVQEFLSDESIPPLPPYDP